MYKIPIFPLNTVLFPGMPLHLHIFEDRYKLMMKHVLAGDRRFGVSLIKNGVEAHGPLAIPHEIGCIARVTHFDPLPDGRINLTAIGEDRFRIVDLYHDLAYLSGSVDNLPFSKEISQEGIAKYGLLRVRMKAYLKLITEINHSSKNELDQLDLTQFQLPEDTNSLLFMACLLLQIPSSEKQPILELASQEEILFFLLRIINRELGVNRSLLNTNEEEARRSSWLN